MSINSSSSLCTQHTFQRPYFSKTEGSIFAVFGFAGTAIVKTPLLLLPPREMLAVHRRPDCIFFTKHDVVFSV